MDIFDVKALLITDTKGKILFKKTFNIEDGYIEQISNKAVEQSDPIFTFKECNVYMAKENELIMLLISDNTKNEIFLFRCLKEYVKGIEKTIKKLTVASLWKKYDLVILLSDSFVYQGIILEDNHKNMIANFPKRPFESVEGMKVPKGMASFINSATKSLGRYI